MSTSGKNEIGSVLESVRDTTQHESVRRAMTRALNILERDYDESGFVKAASALLEEMAKVKRAERMVLWLGPLVALVVAMALFLLLRGFWLGL